MVSVSPTRDHPRVRDSQTRSSDPACRTSLGFGRSLPREIGVAAISRGPCPLASKTVCSPRIPRVASSALLRQESVKDSPPLEENLRTGLEELESVELAQQLLSQARVLMTDLHPDNLSIRVEHHRRRKLSEEIYQGQLRILRNAGFLDRVIYPFSGMDLRAMNAAEKILTIDPSMFLNEPEGPPPEKLSVAYDLFQRAHPKLPLDRSKEEFLSRIEHVRKAVQNSQAEILAFLQKAHSEGIPVTLLLKGFTLWTKNRYGQTESLTDTLFQWIEPNLRPGDRVILFGEKELKSRLKSAGYTDVFAQTTLGAVLQEINQVLQPITDGSLDEYPSWNEGQLSGFIIHLAEPFVVFQKPLHPAAGPEGTAATPRAGLESTEITLDQLEKTASWENLFGNSRPVVLEIGIGNARPFVQRAKADSNLNFFGDNAPWSSWAEGDRIQLQDFPENSRYICTDIRLLVELLNKKRWTLQSIVIDFPSTQEENLSYVFDPDDFLPQLLALLNPSGTLLVHAASVEILNRFENALWGMTGLKGTIETRPLKNSMDSWPEPLRHSISATSFQKEGVTIYQMTWRPAAGLEEQAAQVVAMAEEVAVPEGRVVVLESAALSDSLLAAVAGRLGKSATFKDKVILWKKPAAEIPLPFVETRPELLRRLAEVREKDPSLVRLIFVGSKEEIPVLRPIVIKQGLDFVPMEPSIFSLLIGLGVSQDKATELAVGLEQEEALGSQL